MVDPCIRLPFSFFFLWASVSCLYVNVTGLIFLFQRWLCERILKNEYVNGSGRILLGILVKRNPRKAVLNWKISWGKKVTHDSINQPVPVLIRIRLHKLCCLIFDPPTLLCYEFLCETFWTKRAWTLYSFLSFFWI